MQVCKAGEALKGAAPHLGSIAPVQGAEGRQLRELQVRGCEDHSSLALQAGPLPDLADRAGGGCRELQSLGTQQGLAAQ